MYHLRGMGATLNYPQLDQAITNFEGKPGDLNYRNNNPGNMVYASWMAAYGCTPGGAGGFALCPTMDAGQAILDKRVTDLVAQGNSIADLLYTWAGPQYPGNSQSSYENYVNSVAASTGLDPLSPISDKLASASGAPTASLPALSADGSIDWSALDTGTNWPLIAAGVLGGVLLLYAAL